MQHVGTTLLVDPWLERNPASPEFEYRQDDIDAIYVSRSPRPAACLANRPLSADLSVQSEGLAR